MNSLKYKTFERIAVVLEDIRSQLKEHELPGEIKELVQRAKTWKNRMHTSEGYNDGKEGINEAMDLTKKLADVKV